MSDTPESKTQEQSTTAKVTAVQSPAVSQESKTDGVRNWLIGGILIVAAAIIFGLLYLFVIAPTVPGGSAGWFLFSFATGLTMIVMPCTLPLAFVIVPLSMGKGIVRGLGMALAFGIGVATMLSTYGIIAALLGGFALDFLGNDIEPIKNWVYFFAGSFALVFALSEIGLLNIHMPSYSGAAPAFIQKRGEIIKAFLLGLFLGNVGVGCPHPATPLILIEIATSGDVLYGWLMFLIHAIGRVLPLLLLAFLAILGVNGLNWLMARKATVERVTGWGMVFVAGFILTLGLFTHDWWVNSGIHNALEKLTQESFFNSWFNNALGQNVAHVHGLEDGAGLFGQPLEWGHWFLVLVWLVPIWWWWFKKRKAMYSSPAFKIAELEKEIDRLERDRRQVESMVAMDDLETDYDLESAQLQLDALEKERRKAEKAVSFGEKGDLKTEEARNYEVKILSMQRNYLLVISVFLALVFVHFMPNNFYLAAISGDGHDDHGDHGAMDTSGVHAMPDGTIMAADGSVIEGAVLLPNTQIKLPDGTLIGVPRTPFSKSISGLPEATGPLFVELNDGDSYTITADYVKKEVGNRQLRMLAYNNSIPGPFIKVSQGATVEVTFVNNSDIDQTIHSHGLRLDNRFDGVPNVTQDVVKPGETFVYELTFPDAGVAWYHPHTRDDYGQEMGLYGNYIIEPTDEGYWSDVNREVPLVIDDILIENDQIANFYHETVDHALLGRFGNEYMVNGLTDYILDVDKDEVIRFLITNVSNARTYRLKIPGAEIKLVGAEWGRFEQEEYTDELIISPAERLVAEVHFLDSGLAKLTHVMPDKEVVLAQFNVSENEVENSHVGTFNVARRNSEVKNEFDALRAEFQNAPLDKRALLTVQLTGQVDHSAHAHGATDTTADDGHAHDHGTMDMGTMMSGGLDSIQWDDPSNSDKANTLENTEWQIIDQTTGKVSMEIDDWKFKVGDYVKIRFTNDPMADHVMQHPIHFHGQKFLVLSNNGVPNDNMAWKDTALVLPGEYIDILVEMSNPGEWMAHCHISEHLHAGMMFGFRVEDESGYAPGDEYRATVGNATSVHSNDFTTGPTGSGEFSYNASLPDSNGYHTVPETRFYKAEKKVDFTISVFDGENNSKLISSTHPDPLRVTFVKSDDTVQITTYPGNPAFDNIKVPTPPIDDGHDHIHMFPSEPVFSLINIAHAHGGVDDGHIDNSGAVYTYTMPMVFPSEGMYRAFVEFVPEGESSPIVMSYDVEVSASTWSVDDFGWSQSQKWWILLIISIALIIPLCLFVRRYINKEIK